MWGFALILAWLALALSMPRIHRWYERNRRFRLPSGGLSARHGSDLPQGRHDDTPLTPVVSLAAPRAESTANDEPRGDLEVVDRAALTTKG